MSTAFVHVCSHCHVYVQCICNSHDISICDPQCQDRMMSESKLVKASSELAAAITLKMQMVQYVASWINSLFTFTARRVLLSFGAE